MSQGYDLFVLLFLYLNDDNKMENMPVLLSAPYTYAIATRYRAYEII